MAKRGAGKFLEELAARLGGPRPAPADGEFAYLTVGNQPLALAFSEEAETLAVLAALGAWPGEPARRRELGRELMRANLHWGETGGGVLGLDRDTGLVFLQRRWPLNPAPGIENFLGDLAGLIQTAASWRTRFDRAAETPGLLPPFAMRV